MPGSGTARWPMSRRGRKSHAKRMMLFWHRLLREREPSDPRGRQPLSGRTGRNLRVMFGNVGQRKSDPRERRSSPGQIGHHPRVMFEKAGRRRSDPRERQSLPGQIGQHPRVVFEKARWRRSNPGRKHPLSGRFEWNLRVMFERAGPWRSNPPVRMPDFGRTPTAPQPIRRATGRDDRAFGRRDSTSEPSGATVEREAGQRSAVPEPYGNGCTVQFLRQQKGHRSIWQGGDEDGNLGRVGSLERDAPIFLFIETLWHERRGRFGTCDVQVRERRPCIGTVVAGRAKTLGR